MRKKFNKKHVILASAALALTAALTVGSAMAYFTDYTEASGEVVMDMGFTKTELIDEIKPDGKHVAIKNTGDYDCYVRVAIFAEEAIGETTVSGSDWNKNGDYWEYTSVLKPGDSTSELLVTYDLRKVEEKVEEVDIVVVSECSPVYYDQNGNPKPDWDYKVTEEQQ